MDVAIGLPNAVRGTTGKQLTEFARRAEARGFSSLGTIDRVAYDNYEPLTALAAAAAVTERIGLCTSVLLVPPRINAVVLAKQALSVQELSGGRLLLGLGIGGREDDFEKVGAEMSTRGEEIDSMLEKMEEVWADAEIGPQVEPPRVIIGGAVQASFDRSARHGIGWIAGGAPPDVFAASLEKVKAAWKAAGRAEEPRAIGLAYFSLGPDAEANAKAYLEDYYAFLGAETAGYISSSAAKDEATVQGYLQAFEAAGCDELILFPSASDPEQVDLLADAAGL